MLVGVAERGLTEPGQETKFEGAANVGAGTPERRQVQDSAIRFFHHGDVGAVDDAIHSRSRFYLVIERKQALESVALTKSFLAAADLPRIRQKHFRACQVDQGFALLSHLTLPLRVEVRAEPQPKARPFRAPSLQFTGKSRYPQPVVLTAGATMVDPDRVGAVIAETNTGAVTAKDKRSRLI